MAATIRRRSALLPLLLAGLLTACGGSGRDDAPRALPPARPAAILPAGALTAPNFGDTDPQEFAAPAPSSFPVHGIDASRWQGRIDWATARANGVNFAFLKATEGGDGLDPLFAANRRAALAAGVPVGAYHFWYHCRTADEQARWFIRNVPRLPGSLPPVLDMEWTPFSPTCRDRPAPETIRREARLFLDRVEAYYGQRPLIYATPDFYTENELWRLGAYDFWLRATAEHPQARYAGRSWRFWQYTGTGLVPGIAGQVDLNVFSGSAADWAAWLAARLSP